MQELTKRFGGLTAVNEVSFSVEEGEFLGLIGPNGAGKTTLFHLITGFLKPDAGRIVFRGQSIRGWKPYRICRLGLTRTFQIVKPFSQMTVLENVMVASLQHTPSAAQAKRQAMETIRLVGLEPYAEQAPVSLPIGLKKKLELAKALATRPSLLFLDEVMGGLTSPEVKDLIEALRNVQRTGVTLCMIEHVIDAIVQLCPRTIVMQQGRLIADGWTKEVLNHAKVVEAYLGEDYPDAVYS